MLPEARKDQLLFEPLGDDLIIYDMERHLYHHLNPTASVVWKHCDGRTPVSALVERVQCEVSPQTTEETVRSALLLLNDANLLTQDGESSLPTAHNEARRAFLRNAASAGTKVLFAATIATIIAPTVAQAQSSCSLAPSCKCW